MHSLGLLALAASFTPSAADPMMHSYCSTIDCWSHNSFAHPLFFAIPKTASRHLSEVLGGPEVPLHAWAAPNASSSFCTSDVGPSGKRGMCTQELHRWTYCGLLGKPSPPLKRFDWPGNGIANIAARSGNRVVTMMRDPVDRLISEFFHCVNDKTKTLYPKDELRRLAASAAPAAPAERRLADDDEVDWQAVLAMASHPSLRNSQLSFLTGKFLSEPHVDVDESDLEAVMDLIKSGTLVALVTEDFAASRDHLATLFDGIKPLGGKATARTKVKAGRVHSDQNFDKPAKDDVPAFVHDELKRLNALDYALYDFVRDRLLSVAA